MLRLLASALALSLSASAGAGADSLDACCDAVGARSCPTSLLASGPGSKLGQEGGATRVLGLWRLSCEGGATFQSDATYVAATTPADGTVFAALDEGAAACFDAACPLPGSLCVRHEGDRVAVVDCSTGGAPSATAWASRTVDDTRAVVVNRRVIAVRAVMNANRGAVAAAGSRPEAAASVVAPTGVGAPPVTTYKAGLPPEVRRGTPQAPSHLDTAGWDLTLPPAPPEPCRTAGGMRDASASQVDAGNEAAMSGDMNTALAKYRAAITINSCNAFAWADLGETLLLLGEPARARTALEIATRLMPTHYQAWTNLGRSEEALGRTAAASEAYRSALKAQPGFGPAEEGLQRTRSR